MVSPEQSSETATRLGKVIANGALAGDYVDLPRFGRAWCQLSGSRALQDVDIAALTSLSDRLGDRTAGSFLGNLLEFERAMRVLPIVMRDPDDHSQPFGTHDEWESVDPDVLNACWHAYGDVKDRLDPVDQPLTPADAATISAALAKKNSMLLRSFGTPKLVAWLLSMADQLATSPTPSVGSGDTSQDA
jgi:hypothetical protein